MQMAPGSGRQTARNAVQFSFACVFLALEVMSFTMILQLRGVGEDRLPVPCLTFATVPREARERSSGFSA
jgi:hypothetical protein